MKKICIIIDNIGNKAGIERAVINLANSICSKYKVYIFSAQSKPKTALPYKLNSSVKVEHLNFKVDNRMDRFNSYRKVIGLLRRRYKGFFDFVIGTTHAYNCLLPVLSGKNCVTIGCEHFNYDSCKTVSKIARKLMYPKLDKLVLLTKNDSLHYLKFMDRKKVYVIPNSSSFKTEETANLQCRRIVSLGRLDYQKGYDMLLQVAKIVKDKIPDWHIDVFGDGKDRDDLMNKLKSDGLTDFVTFNKATNDVVHELLNSSIYLMTSRFEGLPMVLIEAQTCGLPIISFDCPEGPSDIVENNKNGFLVPLGAIDEMAKKIVLLANDYNKRVSFGACAKSNSQKFSPEDISVLWENLFNEGRKN